jgi:hypothetical protein
MSRRPRAPLGLRPLAQTPTTAVEVAWEAPRTRKLPAPPVHTREPALAPPVQSAPFALPPAAPTIAYPLDDGSVAIVEVDFRPAVDTAPESLRTQVFALRIEQTALPAVRPTQRITLLETETRHVGPLPPAVSEKAMPEPAATRAAAPVAPSALAPDVLRRCLEALYRSSGATSTADLRLVGIYPRVPVGAIGGVSLGENGAVNLRLRGTGPAAPGMLVVGRRVSTGELATAEVGEDGGDPPAPLRRRKRRR